MALVYGIYLRGASKFLLQAAAWLCALATLRSSKARLLLVGARRGRTALKLKQKYQGIHAEALLWYSRRNIALV
jgi:hypothetical protein